MVKERNGKKQLMINLGAQVLSFLVNVSIGFFLTPFIIENVSSTAYGFVSLANNFVSYVQILTIALNSMAGRFIAIHYYKEDYESVQKYFTSVLYSNLFLSLCLTVPCVLIVCFVDKVVNVPSAILTDVQLLWAFVFGNMLLAIIGSIFNNACYVKNRLEYISLRTIESQMLRAILLISGFAFFVPKVWYIGATSMICTVYTVVMNMYYTKKLMPFVRFQKKYFDIQKVKELLASGIWNSIAQLGSVLSTGLDLLITNIFIGAGPMGIVSISKTVPTYIQSLFITIAGVFAPQLTITYAKDDKSGMLKELLFATKMMGIFAGIPIAFVIAYGSTFYQLWVPSQDAAILRLLTIVTVAEYPITLIVRPLYNVFATTNKVKYSSIVTIVTSLLSCVTVILTVTLVLHEEMQKMVVVVGTSCVFNILKDVLVIPWYCSKLIGVSKNVFWRVILKSLISTFVVIAIAMLLSTVVVAHGWGMLILAAVMIGTVGIIVSSLILLDRQERSVLIGMIRSKLHKA